MISSLVTISSASLGHWCGAADDCVLHIRDRMLFVGNLDDRLGCAAAAPTSSAPRRVEAVYEPAEGEEEEEGGDVDDPAGELVEEAVGDLRAVVAREHARAADARRVRDDGDGHGGEDEEACAPGRVAREASVFDAARPAAAVVAVARAVAFVERGAWEVGEDDGERDERHQAADAAAPPDH